VLLMLIRVMKCNLIVAGFAKCGTSSLHEYLDLHPQVCMSSEKEPHYFSVTKKRERGLDWYNSLFENADEQVSVFGESSTSYAVWEPSLVRIRQEVENPKMILILRDPLERLLSHYRWMYALGKEKLSLDAALRAEERSVVSPDVHRGGCYPWYRRTSNYSYFIPLTEMIFGRENVLLLKSEELARSPQEVLDRCFDFLNLQPFTLNNQIRSNATVDKRVGRFSALSRVLQPMPGIVKEPLKQLRDIVGLGARKRVAPMPSETTLSHLRAELELDFQKYKEV